MQCFACGLATPLASGERVGFRDTCASCDADLHVCRNCRHHDPGAYNECRESSAERVGARDRANRCDYFTPASEESGGEDAAQKRDALENLFRKA